MIQEAAWAGDENIDAISHGIDLWVLADSAIDEGFSKAEILTVGVEALGNLSGEFPGWGQDEDAGRFSFWATRIFLKSIENGQRESGGLAGAGLSDSQEVLSFQKRRD